MLCVGIIKNLLWGKRTSLCKVIIATILRGAGRGQMILSVL